MRLKERRMSNSRRAPARWQRVSDYALAAGILLLVALIGMRLGGLREIDLSGEAHVIDGDTLRVKSQRIRLLGLDAPELHQTCEIKGRDYPCGKRARAFLEDLVKRRNVDCAGEEFDRYGRLLAVCSIGETNLNAQMVLSGWAVSYGGYHGEERRARENGQGLWAGKFDWPAEWRENGGIPPGKVRGFYSGLERGLRRLFGVADD
jgi:endonuclease YncB( thermonuclease family)